MDDGLPAHLSRQRRYQLRKRALGLCERCGQRPKVNATHCAECTERVSRAPSRRRKRKALDGRRRRA